MYKSQLEVREWLELPQSTRVKLASDFNLVRSGSSEVIDHRVVSDGYTFRDLQKISVELMRSYLNITSDESDFYKLFKLVLQSYETKESAKDKRADKEGDGEDRKEQEIEQVRKGDILSGSTSKPKKRRGRSANVHSD